MPTPVARAERWRSLFFTSWALIGVVLLLVGAFYALGRISAALVPFVIAFLFVFLLNSPVNDLERRGVSRGLAVAACFLVAFLVFGVALTFIIPPVIRQLTAFVGDVPRYVTDLQDFVASLQTRFSGVMVPTWLSDAISSGSQQFSQLAVRAGNGLAAGLLSVGSGVVTGFVDVLLAVVISFWALKDLPKMREELVVLAGPRYEVDVETLIATVTRVVGGYLKGQTIASLVTGTIATIGLALIHVPYALVLGIVTFFFNYAPYVGPFAAGLLAALAGLFVSPLTAVLAVAVVVLAQNLTDNLVTPRVMSEQVDLHPTLVIFSLLVGGTLMGIPGMLFAIPVAATLKGLFVYYYERRTNRQLATEDGALFRGTTCEPEDTCEPDGADETHRTDD